MKYRVAYIYNNAYNIKVRKELVKINYSFIPWERELTKI